MLRSLPLCVILLAAPAYGQMDQPALSMPQHSSETAANTLESLSYPMDVVQEPEALELRTGETLPAPELLVDVMKRPAMTLAEWMEFAEAHQPTLIEARAAVARSEQQARQVALPPNPTVGYSGEHIRGGSYRGGENCAFLQQEIVMGRKLALRRDAMRAEGRANELGVEVQQARVRNDVAQRFFDALSAQTEVTLRDRMLKRALDAETNAHELMRVGQADAGDVLHAEISAEEAKIEFSEAQRMFLASFAQLAAAAGKPGMDAAPVKGTLIEPPILDADLLSAAHADESPTVKQAQATVHAAEAQQAAAKREAVPNLTVMAGEWYSRARLDGTNKAAGWMGFAQAGVQVPLWNRNQGGVGAAKAEVARAQASVVRAQLNTRARMLTAAQQYEQARFSSDRYRTQMLPRARRAYELEVMKYQQMGQTYAKVLDAEGMLYSLQLTYVKALHAEWSAAIALQNFALEGALEAPTVTAASMEMAK